MKKIGVYSGALVDPTHLKSNEVTIKDIVHHLSRMNAYNGGTKGNPYNFAERSIIMSYAVDQSDPMMCMAALMHNAPKYVMSDMSRPMKDSFRAYREITATVAMGIGQALGYSPTYKTVEITHIASALRRKEMELLTDYPADRWKHLPIMELPDIQCLGWRKARGMMMNRFIQLRATIDDQNRRE